MGEVAGVTSLSGSCLAGGRGNSNSPGPTASVCRFDTASLKVLVWKLGNVGEVGNVISGCTAADILLALAANGDTDAGSSNGGTVDSSRA